MTITINHHHHFHLSGAEPLALLGRIEKKLDALTRLTKTMKTDLSELEAEVAEQTEVNASAVTLLEGLKAKLDEAGTDPAKLKALSQALDKNSKSLAAAVVANTPAAEEPPAE